MKDNIKQVPLMFISMSGEAFNYYEVFNFIKYFWVIYRGSNI